MANQGKADQKELPVLTPPQLSQGFAQPPIAMPLVIVAGAQCPVCRTGTLYEDLVENGACLSCMFFPYGTICCAGLFKVLKCNHCAIAYKPQNI